MCSSDLPAHACTKPLHTSKLHEDIHRPLCWCPAGSACAAQRTPRHKNTACQSSPSPCAALLAPATLLRRMLCLLAALVSKRARWGAGRAVQTCVPGVTHTSGACDVRQAWWQQASRSGPCYHSIGSTSTQAIFGCLGAQERFTMASHFEQSLPAPSAPHAPYFPTTVSKSKSIHCMYRERGETGKGRRTASGLNILGPRPHIKHAHFTPIPCLALICDASIVWLHCVRHGSVAAAANCAFTGRTQSLLLPLLFLQGGCMYAFQLFETQMHRHMEAICPETSLEQRVMALASTRIHPMEIAQAPIIDSLPRGAPIMVVRGMAVACRVRGGVVEAALGGMASISHAVRMYTCACTGSYAALPISGCDTL